MITPEELDKIEADYIRQYGKAYKEIHLMADEIRRLRKHLKTFADGGTHHDLNPTRCLDFDALQCVSGMYYLNYMESMDKVVRTLATIALEGTYDVILRDFPPTDI